MDTVVITGHRGGIGQDLVSEFKNAGYFTVGIDEIFAENADINIKSDLSQIASKELVREELIRELEIALNGRNLKGLINNAALQVLGSFANLSIDDFKKTIDTNLTAPFILSKILFSRLTHTSGSIVNIGSIHAQLTKPDFVAYATSKAALQGMTQAMAIDFGNQVRVNIIQPAAINTKMLKAGFQDNLPGYEKLKYYHPTGTIGNPEEVAKMAIYLISDAANFINGATLALDGGIGHRLYDPA